MIRKTVSARVYLLPTSMGGRTGPLSSGYRSLLRFEGTEIDFGFELELDPQMGPSPLPPGASGSGRLSFWAPELPPLCVGQRFELREGTRVVGGGTILDPKIVVPTKEES